MCFSSWDIIFFVTSGFLESKAVSVSQVSKKIKMKHLCMVSSLSFSFLSVLGGYMALKNFFFRENWVQSEVAGMKITVFVIFDPTWTHILAPKKPKYESH